MECLTNPLNYQMDNISNSSNIVYIDYRCDEPINEGFIKIETNKNNKLLIYKLPPSKNYYAIYCKSR